MTDAELNAAIAEKCGWKWYRRPATGPWAAKPMRCLYNPQILPEYTATLTLADMTERACNWSFIKREGMLPDYCNDLNAMHEAEELLAEEELNFMAQLLYQNPGRFWRAKARQRAEAFAKTVGIWREALAQKEAGK